MNVYRSNTIIIILMNLIVGKKDVHQAIIQMKKVSIIYLVEMYQIIIALKNVVKVFLNVILEVQYVKRIVVINTTQLMTQIHA